MARAQVAEPIFAGGKTTRSLRAAALLVWGAVFLVGLLLITVWLLLDDRRQTLQEAEQFASNLALSVEQDIRRSLDTYDLTLLEAARSVQLLDQVNLPPAIRQALLNDGSSNSSFGGAIFVVDADGRVLYRSRPPLMTNLDLSDRSYFQIHRDHPHAGLVMTFVKHTVVLGTPSLVLSRRVEHPDGSFGGVVSGATQLSFFDQLFNRLQLDPRNAVVLTMADGTLLGRAPRASAFIGHAIVNPEVNRSILAEGATIQERNSVIDGVRRLSVSRQVGAFPLVLSVDLSPDAVYELWWRKVAVIGGVVLVLVGLASLLLVLLGRELHRRGRAEAAARESAAELQQLSETVDDIIVRVDWNATREYVSPAAERLLGYPPAELVGRSVLTMIHPEDRRTFAESLARLAQDRLRGFDVTCRCRHRNGAWRILEARGRTVPDGSGAIVALRDVTERMNLEARLREAQRMEAAGRLSGGIAHDFNNLLQAQIGSLELLRDAIEESDTPTARDMTETALAMAERAADLTNHLLSFSRKQLLRPERVDLVTFLSRQQDILRRTLGPRISISLYIDPDTGAAYIDPFLLETALVNLAFNARDAMPQGGSLHIEACSVVLSVTTDALEPGCYIVVAMTDEGCGMDEATLARAVEPFFTTKGTNGSGLGLAMVHGFTGQSRGRLRLESEPGRGSRVEMWLPSMEDRGAGSAPVSAKTPDAFGNVLLVDDSPEVLATVAAVLKGGGFDVTVAAGGAEALERLCSGRHFDIMVTDYAMPGTTGGELLTAAWKIDPDLAALVITGYAEQVILREIPTVRILSKPFRRDTLLTAVGETLQARRPG